MVRTSRGSRSCSEGGQRLSHFRLGKKVMQTYQCTPRAAQDDVAEATSQGGDMGSIRRPHDTKADTNLPNSKGAERVSCTFSSDHMESIIHSHCQTQSRRSVTEAAQPSMHSRRQKSHAQCLHLSNSSGSNVRQESVVVPVKSQARGGHKTQGFLKALIPIWFHLKNITYPPSVAVKYSAAFDTMGVAQSG